jgi:hypothetical protein
LVEVLVAEFRGDEEEARFEDAEGRGDGDRVEVLDLEGLNFLLFVLDRDFVEISLLGLQEEEEGTLFDAKAGQLSFPLAEQEVGAPKTHPHLVHDGAGDDDPPLGISKRMSAFGNGNAVLAGALMLVDDVVLGANEHARRAVKLLRRGGLTSGYCQQGSEVSEANEQRGRKPERTLNEKVGARIGRLAPLADDVVESEVELVVGEHLSQRILVSFILALIARSNNSPSPPS